MIHSVKKEIKRLKRNRRKDMRNPLQKLFDRKGLFYRFIMWLGEYGDKLSKRKEIRNSFKSIMRWAYLENPYIVFATDAYRWGNDNHFNDVATPPVMEMILNPKFQKKIGYTVEAMTGNEFIVWWKVNMLKMNNPAKDDWRIANMESARYIRENLDNKVFYLIKHL